MFPVFLICNTGSQVDQGYVPNIWETVNTYENIENTNTNENTDCEEEDEPSKKKRKYTVNENSSSPKAGKIAASSEPFILYLIRTRFSMNTVSLNMKIRKIDEKKY